MFVKMTVAALYRQICIKLETVYSKPEADKICEWLFENKAGITRQQWLKEPGMELDAAVTNSVNNSLTELIAYKPIQYVTGEAWFYHLKLKVTPDVLIPRPETEELVEMVIRQIPANQALSLLDIGTGSGCIPIAIKKNCRDVSVYAIDKSTAALAIARENAENHQAAISFSAVDFLDEIEWETFPQFDIIVSNPPYIPFNEMNKLDKHVSDYEPHEALFVAEDKPLLFYEKIARFGQTHLKTGGKIFTETHESLAYECASLFKIYHYDAEVVKDMSGNDRFVTATLRYL